MNNYMTASLQQEIARRLEMKEREDAKRRHPSNYKGKQKEGKQ